MYVCRSYLCSVVSGVGQFVGLLFNRCLEGIVGRRQLAHWGYLRSRLGFHLFYGIGIYLPSVSLGHSLVYIFRFGINVEVKQP